MACAVRIQSSIESAAKANVIRNKDKLPSQTLTDCEHLIFHKNTVYYTIYDIN